jgi:hypothetical protein
MVITSCGALPGGTDEFDIFKKKNISTFCNLVFNIFTQRHFGTLWATFSRNHPVALLETKIGLKIINHAAEFDGRQVLDVRTKGLEMGWVKVDNEYLHT